MVGRKGGELHRVLQQAWAGGETGSRQIGRAWIVLADRVQDAVVVEPGTADDLEELVGDRKLHVPPGVGQELGQLSLERRGADDRGDAHPLEQLARLGEGRVGVDAHQLRQGAQLLERVSFGDPLRAERDVGIDARGAKAPLHGLAGAGIDSRPQHDERPVLDVRRQLVEDVLEDPHRWVHEFVDGRADDQDHRPGPPEHGGVARKLETSGGQQLGQESVGPSLAEGHASRPDLFDLLLVYIVDADAIAALREREGERQADVPASAHDHQVKVDWVQVLHGGQIMISDT